MSRGTKYQDLSTLATALKVALALYVVVALVSAWSDWLQIQLVTRAANGEEILHADATANDDRQALLGGIYFLVYLATGIVFLRWTYLACRNAGALGASRFEARPGWAVGWYFVPIAALWKPYHALKETFMASNPDATEDWRRAGHPRIMPLWWALWLASNILGQLSSRLATGTPTHDELLSSSWATFASDSVDVPLGIVAIVLVSTMHRWQSERSQMATASVFD